MEFLFKISGYDVEKLLPQVSRALETRTNILSRQKYPGLWKATDTLNAMPKPEEAGRGRRKFFAAICLALGIFLFVPGMMKPQELQGPLFMGAIAIGAGIGGLVRGRRQKKDPFAKAARQLLAAARTSGEPCRVIFREEGMRICSSEEEYIPYADFEVFIEGKDIYLLTFTDRVILLQKRDLQQDTDAFNAFVGEQIAVVKSK